MIGVMSSPIHDYYRCPTASPRRAQTVTTTVQESSDKSHLLEKSPADAGTGGSLLDTLQPKPLVAAMYSLQLMADVVNRALHQCTTSQTPTSASVKGIDFAVNSAPSFCYFFVDMQPQQQQQQQSGNNFNYPQYEDFDTESCHKNALDKRDLSPKTTNVLNFERQRSISECSDDSFICFEEDYDNNPTECESVDNFDIDSSDNITDDSKLDCQELTKRVRFNLKPEVHVMHTWDFAYRAARKGDWQEKARDRDRFQQRIRRLAPTIDLVLSDSHRERVYRDRFLDIN